MTDFSKPQQSARYSFSFSGAAGEYFGIWIVNLLLSIVTLGIYTAWAKVRRLRYFYGNTWLDGHNFEYHAKPMQILIGRIIVVGILAVGNILAEFYPLAALIVFVIYLLALPWLLNKAFAFNARMTSYRNIRLGFVGSYWRAFWIFVILPLIVPVVGGLLLAGYLANLGVFSGANANALLFQSLPGIIIGGALIFIAYVLIIPYVSKKSNEYIANGMSFGTSKFAAEIPIKALYGNLGVALLVLLAPLVLAGLLIYSVSGSPGAGQSVSTVAVIVIYVAFILSFLVYSAGVRNIAFNSTVLGGQHALQSDISRRKYSWIIISNLFVSVISIGLMIPWAAVRTWRYLMDSTQLHSAAPLDQFVAGEEAKGNVTAAEYLDIDGIDFGL